MSAPELAQGGSVTLSLEVTNVSERDGDEVVQVYLEDLVASVAPPVRRLVAFERRTIPAGATATLSFEIGDEQLGFWLDGRFVVEPGAFVLHVGPTLQRTQAVGLAVR